MVSESSQLSILSPPFSWVGNHCWFCLQYGRWTSWVSGTFNSVPALPPHQLSPVWHPAAQWQRERTAKSSSGVRSPIPYACWQEGAESFSHCYNPYLFFFFFSFLPPAWHSCGRWNTATPQSKVLDWECRAAWRKSRAAQVRPLGGLGTAVWPVLQALLGSGEQERVWARWCERDMVWATGLTSSSGGWQLPHLGDRAHWASHLMGTPGWSWRLFPRLS